MCTVRISLSPQNHPSFRIEASAVNRLPNSRTKSAFHVSHPADAVNHLPKYRTKLDCRAIHSFSVRFEANANNHLPKYRTKSACRTSHLLLIRINANTICRNIEQNPIVVQLTYFCPLPSTRTPLTIRSVHFDSFVKVVVTRVTK